MRGIVPLGDLPAHPGFEHPFLVVEEGEVPGVGGCEALLAGDAGDQSFAPGLIRNGHHTFNPLKPRTEVRAHALAEARRIDEISELHSDARVEPTASRPFRRRARRSEI